LFSRSYLIKYTLHRCNTGVTLTIYCNEGVGIKTFLQEQIESVIVIELLLERTIQFASIEHIDVNSIHENSIKYESSS
jgi:hypothetical protein